MDITNYLFAYMIGLIATLGRKESPFLGTERNTYLLMLSTILIRIFP